MRKLTIFCQKEKDGGTGVSGGLETASTGIEVGEEAGLGLDSGVEVAAGRSRTEMGVETRPLTEDLVLAESQFDQGPVAQPLPARTEK